MRRERYVWRESVSVYSGLCNKNVINWTMYKQQIVISHSLEAGSFRIMLPVDSVSVRTHCLIEELAGSFMMTLGAWYTNIHALGG